MPLYGAGSLRLGDSIVMEEDFPGSGLRAGRSYEYRGPWLDGDEQVGVVVENSYGEEVRVASELCAFGGHMQNNNVTPEIARDVVGTHVVVRKSFGGAFIPDGEYLVEGMSGDSRNPSFVIIGEDGRKHEISYAWCELLS